MQRRWYLIYPWHLISLHTYISGWSLQLLSFRSSITEFYLVRKERDERQHGVQPSSTTIFHTVDFSFFSVSALILPRPSNNSYDEREHTSISLTVTHRDRGVVRCNQDSDTPISLSSFCPSLSALRVQASIQNHNWFPISLSSTLWIHWSRERIVPKYATITDSLLDVASLQKSTLMAKKECDVTTRTQHR